jgi:hypothetical protein
MKDKQASEENLMGELDRMYQDVAETESCQARVEHNQNSYEPQQILNHETSTHAKIIPFPGQRIHLPSEEPSGASEEEPERKHSYRLYLIVASFPLIVVVFVLIIIPLKGMMALPGSEKIERHQLTSTIYSTPSPPAQVEEGVLQDIGERQQKETMPYPTFGSNSPFAKKKYYAVQLGAFRNWEYASELIDALRKKDLEPYWIEIHGKSGRIIYVVFSGFFSQRNEAVEFLKCKDILDNYPDSYVREISFQKK